MPAPSEADDDLFVVDLNDFASLPIAPRIFVGETCVVSPMMLPPRVSFPDLHAEKETGHERPVLLFASGVAVEVFRQSEEQMLPSNDQHDQHGYQHQRATQTDGQAHRDGGNLDPCKKIVHAAFDAPTAGISQKPQNSVHYVGEAEGGEDTVEHNVKRFRRRVILKLGSLTGYGVFAQPRACKKNGRHPFPDDSDDVVRGSIAILGGPRQPDAQAN
mmetsp:Transcript_102581/g.289820  ORF Transcript_102581/g.289820 Transcript_102581/m.289820 type:complete len:216 (+) Transcript_102581:1078-1725(+)